MKKSVFCSFLLGCDASLNAQQAVSSIDELINPQGFSSSNILYFSNVVREKTLNEHCLLIARNFSVHLSRILSSDETWVVVGMRDRQDFSPVCLQGNRATLIASPCDFDSVSRGAFSDLLDKLSFLDFFPNRVSPIPLFPSQFSLLPDSIGMAKDPLCRVKVDRGSGFTNYDFYRFYISKFGDYASVIQFRNSFNFYSMKRILSCEEVVYGSNKFPLDFWKVTSQFVLPFLHAKSGQLSIMAGNLPWLRDLIIFGRMPRTAVNSTSLVNEGEMVYDLPLMMEFKSEKLFLDDLIEHVQNVEFMQRLLFIKNTIGDIYFEVGRLCRYEICNGQDARKVAQLCTLKFELTEEFQAIVVEIFKRQVHRTLNRKVEVDWMIESVESRLVCELLVTSPATVDKLEKQPNGNHVLNVFRAIEGTEAATMAEINFIEILPKGFKAIREEVYSYSHAHKRDYPRCLLLFLVNAELHRIRSDSRLSKTEIVPLQSLYHIIRISCEFLSSQGIQISDEISEIQTAVTAIVDEMHRERIRRLQKDVFQTRVHITTV